MNILIKLFNNLKTFSIGYDAIFINEVNDISKMWHDKIKFTKPCIIKDFYNRAIFIVIQVVSEVLDFVDLCLRVYEKKTFIHLWF